MRMPNLLSLRLLSMRSIHISITALLLRSCQRKTPASRAHSSYLGRHSGHRYNSPSSRQHHSGLNPKHSHGASSVMMSCEAQFSAGEDAEAMAYQLTTLLDEHHGHWTLSNGGKGLERDFKFKTFKTTWVGSSASAGKLDRVLMLGRTS